MDLSDTFAFLDVETTGFNPKTDRIIEVGALIVKGGEVVDKIKTLVNPEIKISREIREVTGILNYDLEKAPTFREIKDKLYVMLTGSVLVAHNAQFDYNFLEQEFLRHDMPFALPHFCTVKLSRNLYPQYKTHNLDAVSKRHDIEIENRHRAFDDAEALWLFYQKAMERFGEERTRKTIGQLLVPAPSVQLDNAQAQIGFI